MADEGRTLTDADVSAIVSKLKTEIVSDFYGEVGRGFWHWIKKALLGVLLILAVYGMADGTKAALRDVFLPGVK